MGDIVKFRQGGGSHRDDHECQADLEELERAARLQISYLRSALDQAQRQYQRIRRLRGHPLVWLGLLSFAGFLMLLGAPALGIFIAADDRQRSTVHQVAPAPMRPTAAPPIRVSPGLAVTTAPSAKPIAPVPSPTLPDSPQPKPVPVPAVQPITQPPTPVPAAAPTPTPTPVPRPSLIPGPAVTPVPLPVLPAPSPGSTLPALLPAA